MNTKKALSEARTIVQLVLVDETGDSYYRMRWPGQHLAEQAPNWRVINLDARAEERFKLAREADLLVVYQSNDIDILPLIEARRAAGLKTLAEYNDNFYAPPPASPVAGPWSSPLIWQTYEQIMEASDGVIVTGPGLAELFRDKTTKPIHILENHLPEDPGEFEARWTSENDSTIGFGWAGSLGHIADLLAVVATLRGLLEAHPQLTLHLMGNQAIPGLVKVGGERFKFTNWGTMQEYYKFWGPVHMGFAPLNETPYNRCRSDIKAVEMASRGVLPILADALPYQHFIQKTKAPVFRSIKELKELIDHYVAKPKKLREDAERCFEYVRSERLGPARKERLELYLTALAESCASAPGDISLGYHEIMGTTNPKLSFASAMEQAQKLLSEQRNQDALQLIRAVREKNHFAPEPALNELNVLRLLGDSSLDAKSTEYCAQFPSDIRFWLLRITASADIPNRLNRWSDLVAKLESEGEVYRQFFQKEVVTLFSRNLAHIPSLLELDSRLLELFPNSAELRLNLGLAYESAERFQEAKEQFDWLLAHREKVLSNQEFFQKNEYSYLMTYQEALAKRLDG